MIIPSLTGREGMTIPSLSVREGMTIPSLSVREGMIIPSMERLGIRLTQPNLSRVWDDLDKIIPSLAGREGM